MSLSEPHLAPSAPELVWFGGSDAIRFLNDLISQEIGDMEPGTVRRSLLLTPQGKLDHIIWVLRGADDVGLSVDAGRGEDLVAKLGRYRIRVDVDIELSPLERWLVVGPFGGDPGRWTGDRSALIADVSWSNVERTLVVGERPDLPLLEVDDYEVFRIEAGEPLVGSRRHRRHDSPRDRAGGRHDLLREGVLPRSGVGGTSRQPRRAGQPPPSHPAFRRFGAGDGQGRSSKTASRWGA